MNIYNVSSGDADPNNDYFRMYAAMDAGSASTIRIYQSGGRGVMAYSTTSDYIWKLERRKYASSEIVELKASEADKVGYPNSIGWVPGTGVSALSNSEFLSTGKMKPFTPKSDISEANFIKSGIFIPEDHYDREWSATGVIGVSNVSGRFRDYSGLNINAVNSSSPPFVRLGNTETATTGVIEVFASQLEGCVFQMDIGRNFFSGAVVKTGMLFLPEKFGPVYTPASDKLSVQSEWNSIFAINGGANADVFFRSGENMDQVFSEAMGKYLNENWYGKLQQHLWGNQINNTRINLSSRDPEALKNTIIYCFNYFGASNDIYSMGEWSYFNRVVGAGTSLQWHIGLNGTSLYSNNYRFLRQETAYLPTIGKYMNVNKVFGLPPRTSYSYNLENNQNLSLFTGKFAPGPATTSS
tara:strand:+ start:1208 stop:2440 length:1233 start_codon:yes stop_codon:yes gene_type:complete